MTRQFTNSADVIGHELILQEISKGGILGRTVQLVDFDGQRLVMIKSQCQGFYFCPWLDTIVQVFDGKAVAGIDGSHARSSFSSILDQTNGMLPHGIGQTVHVLAESQTVLEVRLKVARHDGIDETLCDVFVNQAVNLRCVLVEIAERSRAGSPIVNAAIIFAKEIGFQRQDVIGTFGSRGETDAGYDQDQNAND